MPTYEMPVLLRIANKTEYADVLKNVASAIFKTGGFIRKIENWGEKDLPCEIHIHNTTNVRAGHFLFCFDSPPLKLAQIQDHCNRHLSVLRTQIFKQNKPEDVQCTFEEELLPVPYRSNVQKLIEASKRTGKKRFNYNSGLDYYPFMR